MTGPVTTEALVEARELVRQSLKVGAPGLAEPAREAIVRSIMLKLEGKVLAPLLATLQQVTAERDEDRAELARLRAEGEALRAALTEIANACPVTCDMSLAHDMAATAEHALARAASSTGGRNDLA